MQALISSQKCPIFHHLPSSNYLSSSARKNHSFLKFHPRNVQFSFKTRILCSASNPQSLSYGGWDDYDSVQSTAPNQLRDFLNFLGIDSKKYVFVYLFGFVCALAISRVKVSSIIVFPACAFVFALGFSVGLVKGGHLKELKLNENRRKLIDETFRGFLEKLKSLGDKLSVYNAEVLNLKNDIRSSIECNEVTVSDLEGYVNVMDTIDSYFSDVKEIVEGCIDSIINDNQDKVEGLDHESSRRKKKIGVNGLNFSQFVGGLFGEKLNGSKPSKNKVSGKRELANARMDDRKEPNTLSASVKPKTFGSAVNEKFEDNEARMWDDSFDSTVRGQECGEKLTDETRMRNKRSLDEKNDTTGAAYDQTAYSYQTNTSRSVDSQQVYIKDYQENTESMAAQSSSSDSIDFIISMKHKKTAASFSHQQKHESVGRSYSHFGMSEEDQRESERYPFQKEMFSPLKQSPFVDQDSSDESIFGSSVLDDDLEFNNYLAEANNLLKQAKGGLRQKTGDDRVEKALSKSAVLLSKAIEMRPMSLLAVGQLGNTYLLHGELKLRTSRELRSLLSGRRNIVMDDDLGKILDRFEDRPVNKDKITSALVDVCEECEELLIKAGRNYKLALSIDGNDMRSLYNWGLALGFRAQLIADIGPSAAHDADKVFLAAIDKFDAMLSKSNVYAPDALFRWGAALQQRSRLRPKNSREKVKLLQQAKCLFEDALKMDSKNLQLQEALSSCLYELDYWYR